MDTTRSEDREEASYSDDFEHDAESQDSPLSEEKVEIKVYKSAIGSLTVQPKKISKHSSIISDDNTKSARTLSELSLLAMKSKPPATVAGVKRSGSNCADMSIDTGRSLSMKANHGSKTSLNTLGNQTVTLRRPLAQEKVDPRDIPASVAGSVSSVSLSRLSLRNRSATATGYPIPRGTANNIRRVIAHTSIREKSYPSAKFKTYHNPPLMRGSNQPPLKAGLAKPNTNIAQRVASAKRMTIMDLKSKIKLLQDEIEKLKKENRFLNHLHHRQDNALRKWEGKDAELPRLLNQHKDEIRSLQEQLRRTQQQARDHNEKLSVRDKKILRLENELDKLKTLVHEEHLQDRHTLQQDLDITRMNLAGAEKRIREYMRHVEILEKNHKHQLTAQERKFIKANTHTYELQQVVANLKLALRNKDRMLNYIQMRSSGRNLIRAFHAERLDRSDEMLSYGTSIQTDLNKPYQPPPLPPLVKSNSFDFGNSRSSSPLLDDMRDYEFFSRRFSDDYRNDKKEKNHHRKERYNLGESNHRPVSRLSHSLESINAAQQLSPKNREKGISRTVAPCSIKSHGKKDSVTKSDLKGRSSFAAKRSPRLAKNAQLNGNSKVMDNRSDKLQKRVVQGIRNDNLEDKTGKSSICKKSKPQEVGVGNATSKELVYLGSTQGFKYEGPFVNNKVDCKHDSTEILYSPKSDKLSERSLSSTCSSHTVSSSRSEEIISNIDILSARIRESCVLVPPPEEAFKSPRGHKDNAAHRQAEISAARNKTQFTAKPAAGPAGDNINAASLSQINKLVSITSSSPQHTGYRENNPSSFPNGTLHSQSANQNNNASQSNQSFVSPRVQLHSMSLPSVAAAPPAQSGQFQLAAAQTNFVSQFTDQIATQPQISIVTANPSQMMENLNNTSPRMTNNYAPVQTVNVLSEPQPAITFQQEPQTQLLSQPQVQSSSPRLPSDFQYFSFAPNSNIQEGMAMSPNNGATIFQAGSQYPSQNFSSPRAQGQPHSQQTVLVTPSARSAFPRVGFINSNQIVNSSEQSLPSINNTNMNQSSYNPSYYVNLGSWK